MIRQVGIKTPPEYQYQLIWLLQLQLTKGNLFPPKTCKLQSVCIDFKITTGKQAQVMPVSMGDHGPNTGIRLLI